MASINTLAFDVGLELGEAVNDFDVLELFQNLAADALDEFAMEEYWPFLQIEDTFNSEVGTALYSLTDGDIGEIRSIVSDSNKQLEYVKLDRLQDLDYDLTVQGEPTMWCLDYASGVDPQIRLYKVPDDSTTEYTVYSYRNLSSLGVTDTIPMPPAAITAVKMLLRHKVLLTSEEGMEEAAMALGMYHDYLKKLNKRYQEPIAAARQFAYGDIPQFRTALNVSRQISDI